MDQPNYITPPGLAALRARYDQLFADERPKLVEVVSWAAGNGDRSENGDYLYGKKRLRETVTIADEDDRQRVVTLIGDDEQDASAGRIGWSSPIAKALRGASVGDLRRVVLPAGEKEWEVLEIRYPEE